MSSQHPYSEQYIGKPQVITVDYNNSEEIEAAIKEILKAKVSAKSLKRWRTCASSVLLVPLGFCQFAFAEMNERYCKVMWHHVTQIQPKPHHINSHLSKMSTALMESNHISVFTGSSLSEESCALNFSNSPSFLPKENHFFHEIIHFCSNNHKKKSSVTF